MRRLGLLAFVAALALHVAVAGHRPDLPPDGLTPTARVARADGPVARLIDGLGAPRPWLPRDVQPLPLVLLAAAASATCLLARRLGAPAPLAVAVGGGLTLLPATWSTHGAGTDGLVLLAALATVAWVARGSPAGPSEAPDRLLRPSTIAAGVCVAAALLEAPALVWLLIPTLALATRAAPARRAFSVGGVLILTMVAVAAGLWAIARATPGCVTGTRDASAWVAALLLPALGDTSGAIERLASAARAFGSAVHGFGLLVAALGVPLVRRAVPAWPRGAIVAVAAALLATTAGALDPALVVPWALAWWMPWFAAGTLVLWRYPRGRARIPARLALVAAIVLLPMLRHADRLAGPLTNDTVGLRRAAVAHVEPAGVLVESVQAGRIARAAGARLVPAVPTTIAACLDAGTPLVVFGVVLLEAQAPGTAPSQVPRLVRQSIAYAVDLDALAHDIRPGALVAVAATPAGSQWLRPRDDEAARTLGLLPEATRRRHALATIGTLPLDEDDTTHAPQAATRSLATAPDGWALRLPLGVRATDEGAVVVRGADERLVAGSQIAALAVFARDERPVLAAFGRRAPGLPLVVAADDDRLRLARVVALSTAEARTWSDEYLLPPRRGLEGDARIGASTPLHVGIGWHDTEGLGAASLRWSVSTHATAQFVLAEPQRVFLHLDGGPAETATMPNGLSVSINGHRLIDDLRGGRFLPVDADLTHAGVNIVAFDTQVIIPAGQVPGDPRALAAVVRDARVLIEP